MFQYVLLPQTQDVFLPTMLIIRNHSSLYSSGIIPSRKKNVINHYWQIISHKYLYCFPSRPFQFTTNTLTVPFDAVTYSVQKASLLNKE